MRKQGFELRRKHENAIGKLGIIKRFNAEPVACEKKRLTLSIPQCESKHTSKTSNTCFAPGFPCVDDDFRVAARAKRVTERLKLRNEFEIVVNLAIEYDGNGTIFIK